MLSRFERAARAAGSSRRGPGLEAVARTLAYAPVSRRQALGVGGAAAAWMTLGRTPAAFGQGTCLYCPGSCHGPDGAFCDPPCDPNTGWGVSCPDPGGGTHCCPTGNTCCSSKYFAHPCCATGYVCCGGFLCCKPGQTCCLNPKPLASGGRSGSCCAAGSTCNNGQCAAPCPSLRKCGGKKCCPKGQFCCNPDKGLCCSNKSTCCFVGPPGNTNQVCCPDGDDCVREILPGNSGITSDSPRVCCPPERLVTATSIPICCPPGSVHQPGGGLSTNGGLCCTESKVCGQDCCDSLPDFPKKCVSGHCEFDIAKIFGKDARADAHGNVPVPVHFGGTVTGGLKLEAAPSKSGSASAAAAAKKPTVLGSAHFHARHKGKAKVKVHLNSAGRHHLKGKRRLKVVAVITLKHKGKSTSTAVPFTVKHH